VSVYLHILKSMTTSSAPPTCRRTRQEKYNKDPPNIVDENDHQKAQTAMIAFDTIRGRYMCQFARKSSGSLNALCRDKTMLKTTAGMMNPKKGKAQTLVS
jgi:hypothetical protein